MFLLVSLIGLAYKTTDCLAYTDSLNGEEQRIVNLSCQGIHLIHTEIDKLRKSYLQERNAVFG